MNGVSTEVCLLLKAEYPLFKDSKKRVQLCSNSPKQSKVQEQSFLLVSELLFPAEGTHFARLQP